jgi:hypothetical protein
MKHTINLLRRWMIKEVREGRLEDAKKTQKIIMLLKIVQSKVEVINKIESELGGGVIETQQGFGTGVADVQ